MKDMLAHSSSSTMQLLMDSITTSRFDLIMFAIGLVGYIILHSIRRQKEAKGFQKHVDVTFEVSEVSEVADTNQGPIAAPERLSQLLESVDRDAPVYYVADMIEAFLEDYPAYQFQMHEVETILSFCSRSMTDKSLADRLLERLQPTEEWSMLSAFIRFYIDTKQSEKACNLFELNYATFFDIELDEQMQWQLLMAALKCGRQSLADHLLQTSESDIGPQVVKIQQWWRRSSATLGEARVAHMGEVLNRLSNVFNAQFPFDEWERSDDESTAFLGDDSDWDGASDSEIGWDDASDGASDGASDQEL